MLASLYPKMVGYGALWRVDPVNVLLAPETPALTHLKTSKVVHAAAVTAGGLDAISKEKKQLQQQQSKQQESMTRLSINDRLRAIMGDIISEDELEQRFTFGRLLGSGATSKVYAAVDTTTGDEVAVKVFDKAAMVEVRRSMVAEGDYVAEKAVYRVRRRLVKIVSELEISKSLEHPNIIKYIGAYETSHRICIVHELVEGCDLLEHLLANGKMKEAKAAHVFHQLLAALQYCHDRNVYHRDLKLEKYALVVYTIMLALSNTVLTMLISFFLNLNSVLITPDLHVKLIDFGLSEIVAPGQTLKTICGTPLYCSPEVLFLHSTSRQKGFHGGPADVWSIGVLIFALLTGCAPFDDSNFTRLREEVHRNTIAYPAYMSDEVKGMLKALLIFDAHLRPTVKDILAYGYFTEAAAAAEKAAALEEPSSQINEQGSCEPPAPPSVNKVESSPECESPSSKGARRPRSLSALSENGTEGTSSTSGSFDDSATSAATQQQVAALPTHLSCLEIA